MKSIMKRAVAVCVLLVLLGIGVGFAVAGEDSVSSFNPFLKRGYAQIGLTSQQMEAIRAIVKSDLPDLKVMTQQLVAERRALRTLIHSDGVDETAIRAQVAKIAALGADLSVRRAVIYQKVKTVLTPPQIKKAQKVRQFYERMIDRRIAGVYKWYEE